MKVLATPMKSVTRKNGFFLEDYRNHGCPTRHSAEAATWGDTRNKLGMDISLGIAYCLQETNMTRVGFVLDAFGKPSGLGI